MFGMQSVITNYLPQDFKVTRPEGGVVRSVAGYARLGGLLYSVHKYSITAFVILSLNSLMTLQAIPCAYVQIVQYTHNLL